MRSKGQRSGLQGHSETTCD